LLNHSFTYSICILSPSMSKKNTKIPVNSMADDFSKGISIERMKFDKSDFKVEQYESAGDSHRDEGYTFHIVEAGTVWIEIDFQKYEVIAPSVVYMHSNQVHRILGFDQVTVGTLAIKGEVLNTDYINLLEDIVPAEPLVLSIKGYTTVSTLFNLCLEFSDENDSSFYYPTLKDCCNTLVAYLVSKFLLQKQQTTNSSRFGLINTSFRKLLETHYRTMKRPADFADQLNISVSYLNECVNTITGISVSKNIHNRIILEAKRMLYHSDKSIKGIAVDLGYDDYTYFSKLFTKIAGMPALAFRNRNRD
jgi:AraC family transcriptional activator of pobA